MLTGHSTTSLSFCLARLLESREPQPGAQTWPRRRGLGRRARAREISRSNPQAIAFPPERDSPGTPADVQMSAMSSTCKMGRKRGRKSGPTEPPPSSLRVSTRLYTRIYTRNAHDVARVTFPSKTKTSRFRVREIRVVRVIALSRDPRKLFLAYLPLYLEPTPT